MNAPRVIPDTARRVQIEASDPAVSAWVAANAGAGKTHVLAQRVIRLLLDGVEPARILCITFTKAAAANMANRVFNELRNWIALDDAALDNAMRMIGVRTINAARRARARQLFALALETPGGLKVQTIHAFCTHLLHLFPFEANVAARFTVLDEATETQQIERLILSVLQQAAAQPQTPLGRALARAIPAGADQTLREVIREAIRSRQLIFKWLEAAGGVQGAVDDLSRMLAIAPERTIETVEDEIVNGPILPPSEWEAIAEICAGGSKTDGVQCQRLRDAAARSGPTRLDCYLSIFKTGANEPRQSVITASLARLYPEITERLKREQERVLKLDEERRAIHARDRTGALLTIAHAVLAAYQAEKDRRGLLDYDDLIDKTLALLETVSAAWVHYKLDSGIHHLLIDEAQDTSPKQWAIVRALAAEFTAGAGARSVRRTIFAVGDEKQSIFSFQGAVPAQFDDMRRHFERAHEAARIDFVRRSFQHSFRSGENVLAAVDIVFRAQAVFAGVTSDQDGIPPHIALPDAAPGFVEIWETEKPDPRPQIEGWDQPFDAISPSSPTARLAGRIAKTVRTWTAQGRRPHDILILVRRRGALFEAVIRALKNENIPVAGADRLVLIEHIAVMDLMALADALLLPDDELALAAALKSPLFGFDDDDLIAIAANRGSRPLRAALAGRTEPKFAEASAWLGRIAEAARRMTPFAFYSWLLGAGKGRRMFLSRLGSEAGDALDEFLNLALDYEARETPSLQGFMAWLRAARSEVKRDMELARDEVRVMTVHGAKGLEAPVVILTDATTPPQGWHPPRLLALPGPPARLVWATRKDNDAGPMPAARQAMRTEAENEYRRLLYVAMTRAAECLIVCGADNERPRPQGCWYDLVRNALEPHASREPADIGDGTVLRFRKAAAPPAAAAPARTENAARPVLPAWLTQDAAQETRAGVIAPSRHETGSSIRPLRAAGEDRRKALARGTAIHRLLQSLPDVTPERRAEAALTFLARRDKDFTWQERDEIAQGVLALVGDPRFAEIFAPGSRAEVAIAGKLVGKDGTPLPVSGQVDRLVVTPSTVLIADYKTNRPAPRTLADAPEAYLRQLGLYRRVLQRAYPDKEVRAALIWTETLELMEIPAEALDSASPL